MSGALSLTLNALTLISILMLVGLGLAIIFGLMNIVNLAHGEFVTLGAYTLVTVHMFHGGFWLALVLAPIVGYLIGTFIEVALIRKLYERPLATILATWGLSLIIQQLLQLIFGATPQPIPSPLSGSVMLLDSAYPAYRLFLIAMAAIVIAVSVYIFRFTSFGLDVRAVIQSPEMAASLGVNTRRVYRRAFGAGAALAALAGVLVAPLTVVVAQMGVNYLAKSFFVVIVGGAGTVAGVAAGSGIVGGLETILNYHIPVTVSQALVLALAVVIIRFRPTGLIPA